MKVTLDLSKLLQDGKISQAEFDKLGALAMRDVGSLGFNILVGFGVVAVSLGAVALVPTPINAAIVGAAVFWFGLMLTFAGSQQWSLLAQICLVVGALIFAGGVVVIDQGSLRAFVLVTVLFSVAAIVARSGLLMVAAVLALASCIGASTGYWHATYELVITEPVLTVVIFSVLALGTYLVSKRLPHDYERLALMAARTSVFLVNFGFWVGSLWGDSLDWLNRPASDAAASPYQPAIGPLWFSIGWALALAATGIWAVGAGRRWAVNVVAVFAAIHFYTQWFDKLGPSPASFLLGGLLMLGFALGLWSFNRRSEALAK